MIEEPLHSLANRYNERVSRLTLFEAPQVDTWRYAAAGLTDFYRPVAPKRGNSTRRVETTPTGGPRRFRSLCRSIARPSSG